MPNKSYTVMIQIDLNTIDCPGVWLCPKGKAFLKICLFGIADLTKDVDPFFPLKIGERFIFEKDYKAVTSVYELQDLIGRSVISIELLQCPVGSPGCVKLAVFNSLLNDLLHPYSSCFAKPPDTSGIELLFTRCKIFPGIIAPKADVALKVVVRDTNGDGQGPSVRHTPLKVQKTNEKLQQCVRHSDRGVNYERSSRNQAQELDLDQLDSTDSGDQPNEPDASAGRKSSKGLHPETPLPRPKPGTYFSPNQRNVNHYRGSQKPVQQLLQDKSELKYDQPMYKDEPAMERGKSNLPVAFGSGRHNNQQEDNSSLSADWNGNDGEKKRESKMHTGRLNSIKPVEKYKRLEDAYGDEAIRREMEQCKKLLKEANPDGARDPNLKIKYDNCVSNIEWLQKFGGRSSSTDKLVTSAITEEPLQATHREAKLVPSHGKCCKCYENERGTRLEMLVDNERQTYQGRPTWGHDRSSSIDDLTERFPINKWEKEVQREVERKKERIWEREQVIRGRDTRSQNVQGSDMSGRSVSNAEDEKERRERRKNRHNEDAKSREQRDSSSDQESEESVKSFSRNGLQRPAPSSAGQRKGHTIAKQNVRSTVPKPNTNATKQTRPSTTPYNGTRKDPIKPGPSVKRKPKLPPNGRKPKSIQQPQTHSTRKSPDDGDYPKEICDCNLCHQYQELYNPTVHPCPRFRNTNMTNNDQRQKVTGGYAKKLISSRKNTLAKSTNEVARKKYGYRADQNAQCEFLFCDSPIDTEIIEDMNAVQKFYNRK